jgi:hypothetical protein
MLERTYQSDRFPGMMRSQQRARFKALSSDELARVRRLVVVLSDWMDTRFEIPFVGWRFGLDSIIGLIPGLGDAATTLVSLYIVALAGRCGMPRITIARMSLNVAVDMFLGSLPLVGDVFDAWWQANQRNAELLAERLAESPAELHRGKTADWLFVAALLFALLGLFAGLALVFVFLAGALWNGLGHLWQASRT